MSNDATRDFLNSLPEVKPRETFRFSCHPSVPCFNACCSDLTMPLTPYDVLRLCKGLAMGSEEFIEDYAIPGYYEDTGFPLLHLRMEPGATKLCPFLTNKGCGVYEHRSSACRTYPLGRAARMEGDGDGACEKVRYFLVREAHCKGFAEKNEWSVGTWLADQGIEPYNRMNDRYMRLMARYKSVSKGAILSNRHSTMTLLCLYQQDRFLDFVRSTNLLNRVTLVGEYAEQGEEAARNSILNAPEARLLFAFDWMELVLFGSTANLLPGKAS